MSNYDSKWFKNYNTQEITKIGRIPEKKIKTFHEISKQLILKNFLTKDNICSKEFREVFDEYITPKHEIRIEQNKEEGSESDEEKIIQEFLSTRNQKSFYTMPPSNRLSKLLDLKQAILKNHLNQNKFHNNCRLNTYQIPFEYLDDIFENLYKEELKTFTIAKFNNIIQTDLNEKIRATIVNWLVQVHYRFKLRQETLFLAVHIMDKFLTAKYITKNRLQIIGVTSLLIACKYEEIFSPEIRDFVYILDRQCEVEDILGAELEILKVLKFEVSIPSLLRYYDILSINFDFSNEANLFGKYLLELSLLFWRMHNRLHCHVSLSVCYMVIRIFYGGDFDYDNRVYQFYSLINFKPQEIEDCVMEICFILDNIDNSSFQSVRRKYLGKEFLEVAKEFP